MNYDRTATATCPRFSSPVSTQLMANHERIPQPPTCEQRAVHEPIRKAPGMLVKPLRQSRREFLQSSLGVPTALAATIFGDVFNVDPAEANNGGTIAIKGGAPDYGSGYLTISWESTGTRNKGYWLRLGTRDGFWDIYNGYAGSNTSASVDIEAHKLPYSERSGARRVTHLYAQVSKIFDKGPGTQVEEMLSDTVAWDCPKASE
jgi:hypothetical protein